MNRSKINLGAFLHLIGLLAFILLKNYVQGEDQSTIYTRAIIATLFFISQISIAIVCEVNDWYKKGI
jgi:hypothetical protein